MVRHTNIFFIALGIGAALLVVAWKVWTEGADTTRDRHYVPMMPRPIG